MVLTYRPRTTITSLEIGLRLARVTNGAAALSGTMPRSQLNAGHSRTASCAPDRRAGGGRDGEVDPLDLAPAGACRAGQMVKYVQGGAVGRRR